MIDWIYPSHKNLLCSSVYFWPILIMVSLFSSTLLSQTSPAKTDKVLEERLKKVSSATVTDVHRFMGHEYLLPKYFSLPYDVNMNTNVQGELFDPGFLLLAILPILLLFYIKKNGLKIVLMLLMALFYLLGSRTGYGAYQKIDLSQINTLMVAEANKASDSGWHISNLKLNMLIITSKLSEPLLQFTNSLSGKGDAITYPAVVLFFLLITFFLLREFNLSTSIKWVVPFFGLALLFFWWILGAGIFYYGLILIVLGFLLMLLGYNGIAVLPKILHITFPLLVLFSVTISISGRLANYTPKDNEFQSMGAMHRAPLMYGLDKVKVGGAIHLTFPNYMILADKLNKDKKAKIYKAGTFCHYFIDNNQDRVLEDNQLDKLSRLQRKYTFEGNQKVLEVLKKAGFKYLVIDLNLGLADTTPEKTLRKKVHKLNELLANNSSLKLITTDRVMAMKDGAYLPTLYGEKIIVTGTFAAYEII